MSVQSKDQHLSINNRKVILLICHCLLQLTATSQNIANQTLISDTAFINNVLPDFKEQKIVLADRLHSHTLKKINSYLENDILLGPAIQEKGLLHRDTIILSAIERKDLKKKLQLLRKNKWRKNFSANVYIIKRDTLTNIFSSTNRGWRYYHSVYGKKFYSFSKPIFLKEGNLCFFYYDYACGPLCGYGLLGIYKKGPSGWKLLFALSEWTS